MAEFNVSVGGNAPQHYAIRQVLAERSRQDAKWGEQNHDPAVWLAILGEEVGELAQAVLADRFGKADHGSHSSDLFTEATQVAAVAVGFLEYLGRHGRIASCTECGGTDHPTPARELRGES